MTYLTPPDGDRPFAKFINVTDGCWLWTGYVSEHGYAKHTPVKGRCVRMHRYLYELIVGPIPQGLDLDHLCHTQDESCAGGRTCLHRRCVRPDHLRVATRSQNLADARWPNSDKTACPSGHPYEGENLFVNSAGSRECRTCIRASRARRRAAHKKELTA